MRRTRKEMLTSCIKTIIPTLEWKRCIMCGHYIKDEDLWCFEHDNSSGVCGSETIFLYGCTVCCPDPEAFATRIMQRGYTIRNL